MLRALHCKKKSCLYVSHWKKRNGKCSRRWKFSCRLFTSVNITLRQRINPLLWQNILFDANSNWKTLPLLREAPICSSVLCEIHNNIKFWHGRERKREKKRRQTLFCWRLQFSFLIWSFIQMLKSTLLLIAWLSSAEMCRFSPPPFFPLCVGLWIYPILYCSFSEWQICFVHYSFVFLLLPHNFGIVLFFVWKISAALRLNPMQFSGFFFFTFSIRISRNPLESIPKVKLTECFFSSTG